MSSQTRWRQLFSAAAICCVILSSSLPVSAAAGSPLPVRPRTAAPYGFSALRVRLEHSLMSDTGNLIAAYARAYGVGTLFVPIGSDDERDLIQHNPNSVRNLNAMTAVAKVYLVSGDTSWLATPYHIPADAASIATISRAYPQVAGVVFDVDPSQLAGWSTSQRPSLARAYIAMVATLTKAPFASSFRDVRIAVGAQSASERVAGGASGPTILQAIEADPGIGELLIATDANSAATQIQTLGPALAQLTKAFAIVSTTSPYAPRTYAGAGRDYFVVNLAQASASARASNANFVEMAVDGWNDLFDGITTILPQPPTHTGTLPAGPLVPAAGTAYLGGFVNPNGTGPSPAQTLAFEQSIGRTLSVNVHYYGWTTKFPTPNEADDAAHGRIPLIAWNCGASDDDVARGLDDATIVARADAIKAFGSPVMLRWFWEMNIGSTFEGSRSACWDANTDLAGGSFSPERFIAAWRHIHAIFVSRGVTNVVWQWSISKARGGAAEYYPGDDVVDWVGLDAYDLNDASLTSTLGVAVSELAQFQAKPLMISETGAHVAGQPIYLSNAASILQTQYPWIRGFVYFDSNTTRAAWALDGGGLADFATFARSPYMSASPAPR